MAFLKDLFVKIENVFTGESAPELSEFQKKKIMHEFHVFYGEKIMSTLAFYNIL